MVTFEYREKHFYIDGKLDKELRGKIIPLLQKKDKDCVIVIDGDERAGKSVFAQTIAARVTSITEAPFDVSNICMEPLEFRSKIENAAKNEVVIYDEAHRGMAARGTLTEVNKILVDLMMEMGQKNLFVIIILPTFFMLDRYAALFRARGLFHVYERRNKRGFWVYFSRKRKITLFMKGKKEFNYNCMKWPGFRGRFYNQYFIDEEIYREKKALSFKHKPRATKAEVYKEQRDKLIYYIHEKLKIGSIKLSRLMEERQILLKKSSLIEILGRMRDLKVKPTHTSIKN